jgi:Putative metallopeptidase
LSSIRAYDEHGLNQQRAYQIVCYMVGSDQDKFKALATDVKLPEERQDTCAGDYSNAAYSWDLLLKPHRRAPDQPKTKIDVVYGPATGRFEVARQAASSIRLLETVAEHAADDFVWPMPFRLEMQSCGFPNARWDLSTYKLILCYELGADFADLFRAHGDARADGARNWPTTRSEKRSARRRTSRTASRPSASSALEAGDHLRRDREALELVGIGGVAAAQTRVSVPSTASVSQGRPRRR